ncbi:MAG: ribosome small subunit-dependent GTPase A, partial [Erysipelotrichaceae bacterium]
LRLAQKPKVGDYVEFEQFDDLYGIESIYPRNNELVRPPVANIDQALVVMSCHEPDFSSALVDRLSFFCQMEHIKPIICITKMDLASENDPIYPLIEDYKKSGYEVVLCDKYTLNHEIIRLMKDKVTTLIGQSGVGKSSLMNLIDPSLNLSTQVISKALNRGKHTTRHSQLYRYYDGFIADTPGFSALDLNLLDIDQLKNSILDFQPYIQECYFNDCHHINEPKCAVKKAVQEGRVSQIRYENYLKVIELIKENKK